MGLRDITFAVALRLPEWRPCDLNLYLPPPDKESSKRYANGPRQSQRSLKAQNLT